MGVALPAGEVLEPGGRSFPSLEVRLPNPLGGSGRGLVLPTPLLAVGRPRPRAGGWGFLGHAPSFPAWGRGALSPQRCCKMAAASQRTGSDITRRRGLPAVEGDGEAGLPAGAGRGGAPPAWRRRDFLFEARRRRDFLCGPEVMPRTSCATAGEEAGLPVWAQSRWGGTSCVTLLIGGGAGLPVVGLPAHPRAIIASSCALGSAHLGVNQWEGVGLVWVGLVWAELGLGGVGGASPGSWVPPTAHHTCHTCHSPSHVSHASHAFEDPKPPFLGPKPSFPTSKPRIGGAERSFLGAKPSFLGLNPPVEGPKSLFRAQTLIFKAQIPVFKVPTLILGKKNPHFGGPTTPV